MPTVMDTTVLLCDWAEVVAGKIYAQGLGWTMIHPNQPWNVALALLIHVPYDLTNEKHHVQVNLVTEDGAGYPIESPAELTFDFELGRPPGTKKGQEQIFPFAAKLNGFVFSPGGYRFDVLVNDEPSGSASFQAATPP